MKRTRWRARAENDSGEFLQKPGQPDDAAIGVRLRLRHQVLVLDGVDGVEHPLQSARRQHPGGMGAGGVGVDDPGARQASD